MTIASCPRCHESVLVPAAASRRASVRCPLCLEEFLLAEIIDSLPPVLQVVNDPEAGSGSAEPIDSGGAYGLLAEDAESSPSAAPAFSIDRSRDMTATPAAPAARRRTGPVRPQKKKKNAAAEVIKIVLGGIAGLLIAQALLWWMPWQDLRRDPFDLGPMVAKYAPWLVPAKFHGKSGVSAPPVAGETAQGGSADLSTSGLPQRSFDDVNVQNLSPQTGTPQGKPAAGKKRPAELPQLSQDNQDAEPPLDLADPTAILPPTAEPAGPIQDPFDLETPMPEAGDLETDPVVDLESDPMPAEVTPQPAAEPTAPAKEKIRRLPSAPQFGVAELTAALKDAKPAFDSLAIADTDEAINLVKQNYRSFTKLAEVAATAEDVEEEDRQQAGRLLLSLVEKSDVIPMLSRAGAAWFGAGERRTSNGILLVGVVQGITQHGDLYRTELVVSDEKIVAVYGDTDRSDDLQQGDQVLVVGTVVEQPTDGLVGYTGQDQAIVWGPFVRVVPE